LQQQPASAPLWKMRIRLHLVRNQRPEAVAAFREGVARGASRGDLLSYLGLALLEWGLESRSPAVRLAAIQAARDSDIGALEADVADRLQDPDQLVRTWAAIAEKADLVVVMSPFRHGMRYADVLLPIAPFSETSGTFVNCEGRAQSFNGVVPPLGETRPGWKVLRVLGTLLGLPGFDLDSSEAVRAQALPQPDALAARLRNGADVPLAAPAGSAAGLERVADVPIHFADPLVRRSEPLQLTADARPPKARMHRALFEQLGLADGGQVRVRQGSGEAVLSAEVDKGVPAGVVRIAAAHPSTCGLDGLSGPVTIERA
jgi:NADH dehydrogenase/NADH:ubiquinone oxidoreductase subunit G